MFHNPDAETIATLLQRARVIAIVGLSADPTRPSHGVARGLQRTGSFRSRRVSIPYPANAPRWVEARPGSILR
jgi:predicted CoA-binding protein